MINKAFKISKRIAIILLIAAFSIAGIVACGGAENISGSNSGDFVEVPENPTPVATPEPEPVTDFPEETFMWVYSPFSYSHGNEFWVSYLDTNNLNLLWKRHVTRAGSNDNIRWIIRDGDNRQDNPKTGNYYYFDNNANIVHAGKYADKVKVKEFLGGVIVKTGKDNEGNYRGDYVIGGLYKYVLNKDENNSQGQQGYAKYNNNNLNEFMRAEDGWGEGDLTIILMNMGFATYDKRYNFKLNYEFGVDEYYCTTDNDYRKNPGYFLGQNPYNYLGAEGRLYSGEKLNKRIYHSGNLNKFNFRFTMSDAEKWWTEDDAKLNKRVNLKDYKF